MSDCAHSYTGLSGLLAVLVPAVFAAALALPACSSGPATTAAVPFHDDFNRSGLGAHYTAMGGMWKIKDGWLYSPTARNAPLWLNVALPENYEIEFDARSESQAVDIKVELAGDGQRHESGYSFILGGWNNRLSVIARLGEHEPDKTRVVRKPAHHTYGQTYRWKIVKRGKRLDWYIDGVPYMYREDPQVLVGPGHDRFAFSNWETESYYDNLKITALP